MKKVLLFLIVFTISWSSFAQISSQTASRNAINEFKLISSNVSETTLSFDLESYTNTNVNTSRGVANIFSAPNAVQTMIKGAPDVPKFVASLLIPDKALMEVVVVNSEYKDIQNVMVAPSKGNLYRNIDPESIPYTYGVEYSQNKFFPEQIVGLGKPYIIRDFRGQPLNVFPIQYNPVSKVMRVFTKLTLKVRVKHPVGGENILVRNKPLQRLDREFNQIYQNHFINYTQTKYTPVEEQGRLLIISNGAFMSDMQPLVNWKKLSGIPTEIVDVATIGNTSSSIKTYVTNYYTQKGLTYLLLVGDATQVANNSTSSGASDNAYAYITGNDSYPEFFVGRFSAETTAHVQTQVQRTLDYEMNPVITPAWHNKAIGIASNEGAGIGHNGGESDIQHMDLIRTHLLSYTYTSAAQLYHTTTAPTTTQVATAINGGAGIINYIGHGSQTSWGTSGFSNTNVNSLTNTGLLPFIWSVACVNGDFVGATCFAEAWLRATNNNAPSGAVATLMSTINQSWSPPMTGQDEMNDILIETYANNIKRSFGGLSMNGCMKMNDSHGSDGAEMTDTWTIFGDPSLMVRTDVPLTMTVTHVPSIMMQETQLQVNCNVNDAFVSLTINNEIIGTGTVNNNSATISFPQLLNTDSITVCITAYNYLPYIGKVAVIDFMYDLDAGILEIIDPGTNYNCTGLNVTPKIVLRNMGLNSLSSVVLNYKLDNAPAQQYTWNGTLSSMSRDTIILPLFFLTAGNHTYTVFTSNPNGSTDQNAANDSKTQSFVVQNLPLSSGFSAGITDFCMAPASVTFNNTSQNATTYLWDFGDGSTSTEENPVHNYLNLGTYSITLIADAGVCGQDSTVIQDYINVGLAAPQVPEAYNCGPGTVTFQTSATGTITWYSDAAGNNSVGTGNTFTTPTLNNTTTYYVQAVAQNAVGNTGKIDNSGSGDYFGSATNQHFLIFDSYTPFELLSVKVYAGSAGSRTILLRDANQNVLETLTTNIPAGESRVTLDFDVPVGANLQLVGDGSPDLYRNNNNSATYPYTLSGILSITESSASLPQYNVTGNYYYFYDWEVKEHDCQSAIIPVDASIYSTPVADYSSNVNGTVVTFTNNSQQAVSYLWDFGDGTTSTELNPTHIYASIGSFTVTLTVENPCNIDTTSQTIVTTLAAPLSDFTADNLTIYEGDYVNYTDMSANAPTSWYWMFEGGIPSSSTLQNPVVQYTSQGTYYATLVATNTIGSNSMNKPNYITVLPLAGVADILSFEESLSIYPNPVKDVLYVSYFTNTGDNVSINIFNGLGALVWATESGITSSGKHHTIINTSLLKAGVYFIQVSDNNVRILKKLIVY